MKAMTSARLIELLQARRDNDVRIAIPVPDGGSYRLDITDVAYNSLADDIEIRTELWYGHEPDGDQA